MPSSAPTADLSPLGQTVRRLDGDRFLTALFAPPEKREALFALYAFNAEVARIRETVSETILGQMRIQWWRDALATAYQDGPATAHPTAQALIEVIQQNALPQEEFDNLLDARELDLHDQPISDQESLATYLDCTGGGLARLAMAILGGSAEDQDIARKTGSAFALVGLLRAIPFHRDQGRAYIPAEMLAEHQASLDHLTPEKMGPPERAVIAELCQAVDDALSACRRQKRRVGRQRVAAMLPGFLASGSVKALRRADFNPFAVQVQQPHRRPIVMAWTAWRGRY